MKNILTISLFVFWILWHQYQSFCADEYCGEQSWEALYNCRVEKVCREFKSDKPVYTGEDYPNHQESSSWFANRWGAAPAFEDAKGIYRENMGNIYKCGIIQSQRNALDSLLELVKQEVSGEISDVIGWQIENQINRMELSSNTLGCSLTDSDTVQNKLNILKETSFEACRYISYLEYSQSYYGNIDTFTPNWDDETGWNIPEWYNEDLVKNYPMGELPRQINNVRQEIAEEIAHTYKVFPIAYHAYSEYENNFPMHFLLELVRADFIVLRQSLYQAIMPLAQVWLKVINAMSY